METNTQNPQVPQPAAPQPVATPEVQPPKKKGGLAKILIGLAALVVVGSGAGWYFMGMPGLETSETPPTLELGGAGFQGKSVDTSRGSLKIDAKDVAEYKAPASANFKTSARGVQYFYAEEDLTIDQIIQQGKFSEGTQLLVTMFGSEGPNEKSNFWMYPKGPYVNTREITAPAEFKISEGMVFALLTNREFEYNSNVIKNAQKAPKIDFVKEYNDHEGWVLLPIKDNGSLKNKNVKHVFVLSDDNVFEPASELKNNYKIAWIYFEKGFEAPAQAQEIATEDTSAIAANNCTELKINNSVFSQFKLTKDFSTNDGDKLEITANGMDDVEMFIYTVSGKDHNINFDGKEELKTKNTQVKITGGPRSGETVSITVAAVDLTGSPISACQASMDIIGTQPEPESETSTILNEPVPTLLSGEYNCGNNKQEGVEKCDGRDLLLKSCSTYVKGSEFNKGILGCSNDCLEWDTSQCSQEITTTLAPKTIDPPTSVDSTNESLLTTKVTDSDSNNTITAVADITPVEIENSNDPGFELIPPTDYSDDQNINYINNVTILAEVLDSSLDSGHYNMYGFGIQPGLMTPVLYFSYQNTGLMTNASFALNFDGCIADSNGNPLQDVYLLNEADYKNPHPTPVAVDINRDGIFSLNEYANPNGLVVQGNYIVAMDTSSCTYDAIILDIGQVSFENTSMNGVTDTRLIFG